MEWNIKLTSSFYNLGRLNSGFSWPLLHCLFIPKPAEPYQNTSVLLVQYHGNLLILYQSTKKFFPRVSQDDSYTEIHCLWYILLNQDYSWKIQLSIGILDTKKVFSYHNPVSGLFAIQKVLKIRYSLISEIVNENS